jgi:competence protein ComEA
MVNKYWLQTILIIVLLAVIVTGIIIARSRFVTSLPVEISINSNTFPDGTIYIGGDINVPGYYPYAAGDTISDLIQAAGGVNAQTDITNLELHIHLMDDNNTQKININRADVWLLQALPGIGVTLAQRIIDYRLQNGLFPDISSIKNISGIGESEFNRIKELITVSGE